MSLRTIVLAVLVLSLLSPRGFAEKQKCYFTSPRSQHGLRKTLELSRKWLGAAADHSDSGTSLVSQYISHLRRCSEAEPTGLGAEWVAALSAAASRVASETRLRSYLPIVRRSYAAAILLCASSSDATQLLPEDAGIAAETQKAAAM